MWWLKYQSAALGAGPAPGSAVHLGAELSQAPQIFLVTQGLCSECG